MNIDEQWEKLKPTILRLLDAGWSKHLVFHKVKIRPYSAIYFKLHADTDFKELVKTYNQQKNAAYYERLRAKQISVDMK
jgi:hypothetical protein